MEAPSGIKQKKAEFWKISNHPSDMYENIKQFFTSSICKYSSKLLFT